MSQALTEIGFDASTYSKPFQGLKPNCSEEEGHSVNCFNLLKTLSGIETND